jgi:Icc-related predicted phosphoesterase
MKQFGKSIDKYYVTYGEVAIAGVGNENWSTLNYDDLNSLKKNFDMMKPKKRVLVSHWHAKGTKAEFSGVEGDRILRKAVEELKPDLLISAHIHEAEGIEDKIGKTKVVQVGRRGTIIDL